MPNHCTNELRLVGPKDQLDQFRLDATKPIEPWTPKEEDPEPSLLNFQGAVPYPVAADRHASDGWYNWSIKNWGTKWNAYDVTTNVTDQGVSYNFTTAWAPPESWLRAATEKYPEIKFMLAYFEGGCDFCGILILKGDEELLIHEASPSEHYGEEGELDDEDSYSRVEDNFWDDVAAHKKDHDMSFRAAPHDYSKSPHPF